MVKEDSMDFKTLTETVKEFPYSVKFRVSQMVPDWDLMTEEEKIILLRDFMIYAKDSCGFIYVDPKDLTEESLDSLDILYTKENLDLTENYREISEAAETAYTLRKMETGREFILPELERENDISVFNAQNWNVTATEECEKALCRMIEEGLVPYLEIAGKAYGFTVFRKI